MDDPSTYNYFTTPDIPIFAKVFGVIILVGLGALCLTGLAAIIKIYFFELPREEGLMPEAGFEPRATYAGLFTHTEDLRGIAPRKGSTAVIMIDRAFHVVRHDGAVWRFVTDSGYPRPREAMAHAMRLAS